jgi:hypothetical protein
VTALASIGSQLNNIINKKRIQPQRSSLDKLRNPILPLGLRRPNDRLLI